MNARPWNAIVGGVLGTAVLTLMMYVLAPMMLGRPMDIAAMLSRMLGGSWALGMLMHLLNGIIIFPLIYLYLLAGIFPGQPWLKGTLWGPLLWVLLEVVAMPMMGGGLFSVNAGGAMAVIAALVAHVVYGALLGQLTGDIPRARAVS